MAEFLLPKLGADMTEGKLLEWLKKPGERVARGEPIALIETDKANIEAESWVAGTLERVLVEPGDAWLPVGTPLAVLKAEGEAAAPLAAPAPGGKGEARGAPAAAPPARPATTPAGATVPATLPPGAPSSRLRASPAARRRAEALGLALDHLHGTGPEGRITLEDVDAAAQAAVQAAPPSGALPGAAMAPPATTAPEPRDRMREAIAAAMTRAHREIPQYYLSTTIDLQAAQAWLDAHNATRPVTERLLVGALLLKAAARALSEVPELNGYWIDGRAQLREAVHLGLAVSIRGGGLIAPAIHDAQALTLEALMARMRDLVQRARSGALQGAELTDATITVTSLGDRGVEAVYGIINPPQLALVGFGTVVRRPWVVGEAVVPRPVVVATLSGDHRASDGHRGALYLAAVDHLLQSPETL